MSDNRDGVFRSALNSRHVCYDNLLSRKSRKQENRIVKFYAYISQISNHRHVLFPFVFGQEFSTVLT